MPILRIQFLLSMLTACAVSAAAQTTASDLPPGVYVAEYDYRQATAGTYALDPEHTAVIARVSHLGYSYSVFRFDRAGATLQWDPANPAVCTLDATVDAASIASPVKGFAEHLAGDDFLKADKFPQASFKSIAFRQTGPHSARIDGDLTLMGKTRPVTFDVALVGAGKGFAGQPRIGATARADIKPVDFGLPPLFGETIEIVIDGEFERKP